MDTPITIGALLPYYFVSIAYLLIIWMIGKLIRRYLFHSKESISAFSILCDSIVGWVALVTVYSIVLTQGKTVNLLFVVLAIIYCWQRKKCISNTAVSVKDNPYCSNKYVYPFLIIVFSCAAFLFQIDKIFDWQTGMFDELYGDFCYNIKLTQFLNLGFENRYLGYNFYKEIAPMPYHYFEMWTTAMIYPTFGLIAGVCHMVTTPVVCVVLMLLCFVAVWEHNRKLSVWGFLCIIGCFLTMDLIPLLVKIHPRLTVATTYLLGLPRAMPSILAILFCFVLFYYQRKKEAYYALLAIPILTLVPSVAVFGTVGLSLLVDTIHKKRIDWTVCFPYMCLLILFALYVLSSQGDHMGGESFHIGLLRLYITQPIIYFLAYLHCIVLLWLLDRCYFIKIVKSVSLVLFFLFLTTETLSIFLRAYNYDATQFTSGSIPYFLFALYTTSLLYIISKTNLSARKYQVIGFYLILNIGLSVYVYSRPFPVMHTGRTAYIQKVLRALPKQETYRIGGYIGENQQADNMVGGVVDGVACPEFLDTYMNGVWHFAVNKGSWEVRNDWDKTPYRDYYAEKKSLYPTMTDDEIRIAFIQDSKIEYIRIYKSAKPSDWFLSHLQLLAEDEGSGERFYQVKK